MTERFMVDDCGTLIDMTNRNTYDYVSDVCSLLNEQHETIQRLKQNIDELLSVDIEEELLKENEQLKQNCKNYEWYKQYKNLLDENEILTDAFEQHLKRKDNRIKELKEENKELQDTIEIICKDFEESHGMDIRNADWFTAW